MAVAAEAEAFFWTCEECKSENATDDAECYECGATKPQFTSEAAKLALKVAEMAREHERAKEDKRLKMLAAKKALAQKHDFVEDLFDVDEDEEEEALHWKCKFCQYVNGEQDAEDCGACGSTRPGAGGHEADGSDGDKSSIGSDDDDDIGLYDEPAAVAGVPGDAAQEDEHELISDQQPGMAESALFSADVDELFDDYDGDEMEKNDSVPVSPSDAMYEPGGGEAIDAAALDVVDSTPLISGEMAAVLKAVADADVLFWSCPVCGEENGREDVSCYNCGQRKA
jgi:hypothetical protein